jgi:hypothetical protein
VKAGKAGRLELPVATERIFNMRREWDNGDNL